MTLPPKKPVGRGGSTVRCQQQRVNSESLRAENSTRVVENRRSRADRERRFKSRRSREKDRERKIERGRPSLENGGSRVENRVKRTKGRQNGGSRAESPKPLNQTEDRT